MIVTPDTSAEALRSFLLASIPIERAEVLAQANQGSFEGEPWRIIQTVLRANPAQLSALLLAVAIPGSCKPN